MSRNQHPQEGDLDYGWKYEPVFTFPRGMYNENLEKVLEEVEKKTKTFDPAKHIPLLSRLGIFDTFQFLSDNDVLFKNVVDEKLNEGTVDSKPSADPRKEQLLLIFESNLLFVDRSETNKSRGKTPIKQWASCASILRMPNEVFKKNAKDSEDFVGLHQPGKNITSVLAEALYYSAKHGLEDGETMKSKYKRLGSLHSLKNIEEEKTKILRNQILLLAKIATTQRSIVHWLEVSRRYCHSKSPMCLARLRESLSSGASFYNGLLSALVSGIEGNLIIRARGAQGGLATWNSSLNNHVEKVISPVLKKGRKEMASGESDQPVVLIPVHQETINFLAQLFGMVQNAMQDSKATNQKSHISKKRKASVQGIERAKRVAVENSKLDEVLNSQNSSVVLPNTKASKVEIFHDTAVAKKSTTSDEEDDEDDQEGAFKPIQTSKSEEDDDGGIGVLTEVETAMLAEEAASLQGNTANEDGTLRYGSDNDDYKENDEDVENTEN